MQDGRHEQLHSLFGTYVWTTIRSPGDLGRIRMAAMTEFLVDFEQGKQAGRYLPHELPDLPFSDGEFELALCSHFLFAYSDQLSADFHCRVALEMCRVADEVRVFPLLDQGGEPSPHVEPVCAAVQGQGFQAAVHGVRVPAGRRPDAADLACARYNRPLNQLFHPSVIAVTHVPPFKEAAWYNGRHSDDNYRPHFACKAVGDVMRKIMEANPKSRLLVLCGHTHGSGEVQITQNLDVLTEGAEYGNPVIQRIFDIG